MAGNIFDSDQDEAAPFSSINVTPFVDVVLVLLVIFMITAPALIKEIIDIRLPKTATSDGQKAETIGVAINKERQIFLNGILVDEASLLTDVRKRLSQNQDLQGIISADVNLPYGTVVKLIDQLKIAGLEKFAVQIEKEKVAE